MNQKKQQIDTKINAIYANEYDSLADKSEELFDRQEALDAECKELKKSMKNWIKKLG